MMDALNFLAGSIYLAVALLLLGSMWRRNLFGWYAISVEYFYILGLGIYPIAHAVGLAEAPKFLVNDNTSLLAPLHICAYAVGAIFGFYAVSSYVPARFASFIVGLNIHPKKAFAAIIFISGIFAGLYIFSVGPEQALVGASYARSGNFDYFDAGTEYAFLKRPMMIGLLASAYAYYYIYVIRRPKRYLVISLIVGLIIYSTTVSRYALFQSIIVPLGVYVIWLGGRRGFSKLYSVILISIGVIFSIVVLLFGKLFLSLAANYIFYGRNFDLSTPGVDIFGGFSHLYYSIEAGIRYFSDHGIIFFRDVVLAPLGILPSSIFSALGLESLSYQFVPKEESFSCVNTSVIVGAYEQCFLPPYFTGASAYFLPVLGGFFFGFIRFHIYGTFSRAWQVLEKSKYLAHVSTLIVLFIFFEQVMLFIPSAISLVIFMAAVFLILVMFKIIKY